MLAAVVNEWGAVPTYTEFPEPQPRDGAEVADVEAAALTNLTRGLVSGKHYASKEIQLPAIPGVDGVARLSDGRRVYTGALGSQGTMAQRTLVDPAGAVEVPAGLDSVTAAAIPNPGVSAWLALSHAAAVTPGAHVLILGATGSPARWPPSSPRPSSARAAWWSRAATADGLTGCARRVPTT